MSYQDLEKRRARQREYYARHKPPTHDRAREEMVRQRESMTRALAMADMLGGYVTEPDDEEPIVWVRDKGIWRSA